MNGAAITLITVGWLLVVVGIVKLAGTAKKVISLAEAVGDHGTLRTLAVFRATSAGVRVIAVFLFVLAGAGLAVYLLPAALSVVLDVWLAIWRNIVDAYHTDRVVKFIVWIAAAIGAGFATLFGALLLLVGFSRGLEMIGEQFAELREALNRAAVAGVESPSRPTDTATIQKHKTRREGLLWLGLAAAGLLLISAGVGLAQL